MNTDMFRGCPFITVLKYYLIELMYGCEQHKTKIASLGVLYFIDFKHKLAGNFNLQNHQHMEPAFLVHL